jgi:hypothetical protein
VDNPAGSVDVCLRARPPELMRVIAADTLQLRPRIAPNPEREAATKEQSKAQRPTSSYQRFRFPREKTAPLNLSAIPDCPIHHPICRHRWSPVAVLHWLALFRLPSLFHSPIIGDNLIVPARYTRYNKNGRTNSFAYIML